MVFKKIIEKYRSFPNVLKATFWFTIASFFQKGLSVITTPIFTRIMSTEEYGVYNLYMSWHNIFIVLCTLNLASGMLNSFLIKDEDNKDKIISSVLGFEFFLSLIILLGYIGYTFVFGNLPGLTFKYGILMFIEIIVNIPVSIWLVKQKFSANYKAAIIVFIQSVLITILSVVLVITLDEKAQARIYGTILGAFMFSILCLVFIILKSKNLFDFKIWKMCLIFGGPLIFHFLAQSIMGQSDKLIIDYYYDKTETAIYSVAHSISWLLYIFITAVNSTIIPWIYKKIKKTDYSGISNIILLVLFILSVLVLIVSMLSPELIWLFGGDNYKKGATMIPPLAGSLLFIYITSIFTNFEFYYKKTIMTVVSTIIGAGVNVGLNFIFIPIYGPIAACYTTLISYFIINIIHCFVLTIILRKNNEYYISDVLNIKLIYFISLTFLVGILLIQFIFDYLVIRILILSLSLIILVFFSYKFKKILYKRKENIENE